jgi:hypothetical protein
LLSPIKRRSRPRSLAGFAKSRSIRGNRPARAKDSRWVRVTSLECLPPSAPSLRPSPNAIARGKRARAALSGCGGGDGEGGGGPRRTRSPSAKATAGNPPTRYVGTRLFARRPRGADDVRRTPPGGGGQCPRACDRGTVPVIISSTVKELDSSRSPDAEFLRGHAVLVDLRWLPQAVARHPALTTGPFYRCTCKSKARPRRTSDVIEETRALE